LSAARFEPEKLLRALVAAKVEFVLIGGVAATLHGSNLRTGDVDVCPRRRRDNLKRLAGALRGLGARVRAEGAPEGIPFDPDPALLERMELLNLSTRHGDFDLVFAPPGTGGYDDLWARHVTFDLDGLAIPAASLDDLIRTKEAAGRKKDLDQLPTLRALRELASD
jgi:hypothetical protein